MLSKKRCAAIAKRIFKYKWYSRKYIKQIQTYLNKLGYKLTVDGIPGYYTINAIYSFQKKYKLLKDGLPGPQTLKKLKSLVAAKQAAIYMTAADWKKAKYFKLSEFKCGCVRKGLNYCDGYPHKVTKKLIAALLWIRKKCGNNPVISTSGLRCQKYNDSIRGSITNSKHVSGDADDFWVKNTSIKKVLSACKAAKNAGIIKYYYTNNSNMKGAVHINV